MGSWICRRSCIVVLGKMEYKDDVHGNINIPKHIYSIIQTPHFQRLKKIKQLGISYKTLPQSNGNRYDHCIGTYYLAKITLDALEKNTKDLIIPDFYKKVVTIAALLHDIGHGPFSHLWESICCRQYHHEENSSACIDEIFKICLIDWDVDRTYAKELIKALILGNRSSLKEKEYSFLFDVVNNKNCEVDVDKWDYLQRDYYSIQNSIEIPQVDLNFKDVFLKARVSDDRSRIEYRYCDFRKIYNIFDARTKFHIHIYQRPINICMQNILKYVLSACESNLELLNGLKLTDIRSQHVDAFLQLDDDFIWKVLSRLKRNKGNEEIVHLIECLENPNLSEINLKSDEEKPLIAEYMKAIVQIENAGQMLKSETITFYGNPEEKPKFEQIKGFHETITYFKLN